MARVIKTHVVNLRGRSEAHNVWYRYRILLCVGELHVPICRLKMQDAVYNWKVVKGSMLNPIWS